jgi:LysR family hydrogen peroxide-inducible transcriptional activator
MLSLQQMNYLIILDEERHFQRASERCHVTQPTLSMQVKKAEEWLGHSIFDRNRNPIELTSFGKELLPIIRNILFENQQIDVLLERMSGQHKQEIRMGIIPTISCYLVPDLFPSWRTLFPELDIVIREQTTEEAILSLERKELDVVIMAGPFMSPSYRTTNLFREAMLVFMPSVSKKEVKTEDLSGHKPWLLNPGNCLRTQMMQFCDIDKGSQNGRWDYQGGNIDILLRMVEEFGGYTLVPKHYHLRQKHKDSVRYLVGDGQFQPARQVIGVSSRNNLKWSSIEKVLRTIQFQYPDETEGKLQILDWNAQ